MDNLSKKGKLRKLSLAVLVLLLVLIFVVATQEQGNESIGNTTSENETISESNASTTTLSLDVPLNDTGNESINPTESVPIENQSLDNSSSFEINASIGEELPPQENPSINQSFPEVNLTQNDTGEISQNLTTTLNDSVVNFTNTSLGLQQINQSINRSMRLAETVGGESIHAQKITEYILWHQNFTGVQFKDLAEIQQNGISLKSGNFDHELKGARLGDDGFAIELINCDKNTNGCFFKINGVRTEKVYPPTSENANAFSLNENYELRIKSIQYDFCDNRRFCDAHFDAYDIVEVEVIAT